MNKLKSLVVANSVKTALPLLLGFAGGLASTFFPAYFTAFCSGSL